MKIILGGLLIAGALALGACGDDDDAADTTPTTAATASTSGTTAATSAPAASAGLDTKFGTNGVLVSPISATESDRFMAVAVGSDGSAYAAGFVSQGGDNSMALAKFKADGTLDKAFGKDGYAIVNVAVGGKTAEVARAVAIQSSGKIIIGGPFEKDTTATGDAAKELDVAVVRFDATGKLDLAFGKEGIAKIDLGAGKATSATAYVTDTSWGLGSLAGDKVVLFGSKLTTAGGDRVDTDYVMAGLTSAGVLDTSFGTNGQLVADLGGSGDSPRNVAVQADGKIVATGYSNVAGVVQPVIIRATANGQFDTTFGTGGIATAKVLEGVAESYAVALQGDAYVLAGYGRGADTAEKVDMIVDRFTAKGEWDKTFGTDGVTRLDIAKEDDRARNVITLPDGRILAIGSGKKDATNIDGMVYLVSKDGKPVAEFGTQGYIIADLGGPNDSLYGAAVSADKKFAWVVGYKGDATGATANDDAVVLRITL